jgi:hypothetical protein
MEAGALPFVIVVASGAMLVLVAATVRAIIMARCNIPRFLSNFGGIFFAFVSLEMIGNSQEFKTFKSNLKFY